MTTQVTNYKEQAKRIKELTKALNKQADLFVKSQNGKRTYFGDLAAVCMELENQVKFLGGKI